MVKIMNHCASVCASVSYSASIRLSVPPSLSLFILKKKLSPNIEFVVAPGLKKKLNGEHGQAINLLFPFIWHTLYTCINFILLSPFNVLYLFLFFFLFIFSHVCFIILCCVLPAFAWNFFFPCAIFYEKKILCKGRFFLLWPKRPLKRKK